MVLGVAFRVFYQSTEVAEICGVCFSNRFVGNLCLFGDHSLPRHRTIIKAHRSITFSSLGVFSGYSEGDQRSNQKREVVSEAKCCERIRWNASAVENANI